MVCWLSFDFKQMLELPLQDSIGEDHQGGKKGGELGARLWAWEPLQQS
jgi:hypothetical protein